ncbi:MAG TPA: hypothetical protein VME46_10595, partial [Acidimicrobiales bacterium]|nr:hypothetical protein [Acidimicrobiales bacterium]
LTIVGVINPPPGTISDFTVATSSDSIPADAAPYSIGLNAAPGVAVSVDPSTAGALATYAISNLVATAPLAGGSGEVTLEGDDGTVFPNTPSYYFVQDETTPAASGTVRAIAGGGSNEVGVTVPFNIVAGDHLAITVQDVINPGSAGAAYSLTLLGAVSGPTALAPFPRANLSYPNGAIVDFSGADYVMAGGHAFPVTGTARLAALVHVDRAELVTAPLGTAAPSGPPRAGTLLFTRPVNGSPTIYVTGTDGKLHGFASPQQFVADGYDAALVVTVSGLAGVPIGSTAGAEGAAVNALATSADGGIVDSSGTFYVFAGGRAFPVPSLASLAAIKRTDHARPLVAPIGSAQVGTPLATGTLLNAMGEVYVAYEGDLWPFKSEAQLVGDGYGGTPAVPVPSTGGATLVATYSGE